MDIIEFSNIENVHLMDNWDSSISVEGKIHITVTHLIFQSNDRSREIWILLQLIASVDSPRFSSLGKSIVIKCKDFHVYRFTIEDSSFCVKLKEVIVKLIDNIDQHCKLPCFFKNHDNNIAKCSGWIAPTKRLITSFTRMGLPNDQWKFTDINKDHKISDTYPAVLVVPEFTLISTMKACSKFRSRGRLPALTYFYNATKAALCRCSQPRIGFSARCIEDITMLKRIKDVATEGHRDVLHVVDPRPKINALSNKMIGKGYETAVDYEDIVFQFFDIENIHVMKSSLEKMIKACRDVSLTHSSFISAIDKSGWLKHIKVILDTSFSIAKKLISGENVVVHCSDGWDRTSQVCGLAQVVLDPYYRTFEGLEDLIEKDWLAFGHKFSDRCGHLSGVDSSEVSPVFTQFLDCLYQLFNYYPDQFQYNERLLRYLHRWAHSCEYGTFVGNCEKDRIDLKISELTPSVWAHILYNQREFSNPYYRADVTESVLGSSIPTWAVSVWMPLYSPNDNITSINWCSVDLDDNIFNLQKLSASIDHHNDNLVRWAQLLMTKLSEQVVDKDVLERLSGIKSRIEELGRLGDTTNNGDDDDPIEHGDCNGPIDKLLSSVSNTCDTFRLQRSCYGCHGLFEPLGHKNLCFGCGKFFCTTCISKKMNLCGHGKIKEKFPVCKSCSLNEETIQRNIDERNHSLSGNIRLVNGTCESISEDPLLVHRS